MNKNVFIYFLIIFVSFYSCDKKKEEKVIKPEKVKKIVQALRDKELAYNTVFIKKLSVDFNDGKKRISVKGYLKSIKDSMITISIVPFFGIELARIYFGNDSVIMLNRIEKIAYVNSYDYFNKKYNFNIGLSEIQKIILNSFLLIDDIHKEKYIGKTIVENKNHIIDLENDVRIKLIVSAEDRKLISVIVDDERSKSNLTIDYIGYREMNNKYVPDKILIKLINDGKKYTLKVNYSNIEINKSVLDNFKINSKYKRVLLK